MGKKETKRKIEGPNVAPHPGTPRPEAPGKKIRVHQEE